MLLKRLYDHSGGSPKVTGVRVLRAGQRQHFSPNVIHGGVAEGWLSMSQGQIVLTGERGTVVYRISRAPGHYCCHCGEPILDAAVLMEDGRTVGQKHIAEAHANARSPDPNNPAGYERINYYDAVRLE